MITSAQLQAIAAKLEIQASQIVKVNLWDSVILTVSSKGCRFVSKDAIYTSRVRTIKVGIQQKLFKRFLKSHTKDWCLFDLKYLTIKQIKSLISLMGETASGSKKALIKKLCIVVRLRNIVAPYAKKILEQGLKKFSRELQYQIDIIGQEMARDFKHKALLNYIRSIKIFAVRNKLGMAKSLITWLLNALDKGQQNYQQAVANIKTQAAA